MDSAFAFYRAHEHSQGAGDNGNGESSQLTSGNQGKAAQECFQARSQGSCFFFDVVWDERMRSTY